MELITEFIHSNAIIISALILLIAYIFIAIEKIPKVTVAILGAAITLILGLLGQDKLINGTLAPGYFINFIDFNVIFLLVSMMIVVSIASRSGMFNWIAVEMLKLTKGNPKLILISLGVFTAVASAFLDNVTTVILVMPVTFLIAKELEISPMPFLITEILTSNIGGTATLIGDPPNIIIGSAAGLSFMDFLMELTDIVALILIINIILLVLIFRKQLSAKKENMEKVVKLDNSNTIKDRALMVRSGIVLLLVIAGFILHDVIHIQSCIVAMAGAAFLMIFERPDKIFEEIEWNTIFFFIGLFIIIGGLEHAGGIKLMSEWLLNITDGSQKAASLIILWASGILSGIIDNIPYTATMAPLLIEVQNVMGHDYAHPLWWCLSLGACLGGNMTIIGAAANVIVSETASDKGYPITFMYFLKFGVLSTVISLAMSTVYIWFRFLV